jgi:hypothetical protein
VALLTTRQANPDRLVQLNGLFGCSPAYLLTIYLEIVKHIVETFWGFIAWNPRLNEYKRLRRFGRAVGRRTGLRGCRVLGFVDGTFRPFCKPTRDEHLNYSGHKQRHGFKYQAIATPNDLVLSLFGPYRATENDWSMLGQLGVQDRFCQVSFPPLPFLRLLMAVYRSTRAASRYISTATQPITICTACSRRTHRSTRRLSRNTSTNV